MHAVGSSVVDARESLWDTQVLHHILLDIYFIETMQKGFRFLLYEGMGFECGCKLAVSLHKMTVL
jgi:hypothetical protein